MNFAEAMKKETTKTLTENGGNAYNTTGASSVLDLFAIAGAMRNRIDELPSKFMDACQEDTLLATRLMFYTRDIRGGLGERDAFRSMLVTLSTLRPYTVIKNIALIPFYGRWDDLFVLVDTPVENEMLSFVFKQLIQDIGDMKNGAQISLLAKWMPSINASSPKTKRLARKFAKFLGLTEANYRRTLSTMRAYLNVLERKMSRKEWESIQYNQVPSRAMNVYRRAFYRNDELRFTQYLDDVAEGKQEIKAGTLYPYDIIEKYIGYGYRTQGEDAVLEAQWKALPNYIEGENNIVIMADVSGSMYGRPIATSIGLAIYFAERNQGAYKDLFMTFSARPEFVKLKGRSLVEKIRNAESADWDMNTNLEAAFQEVLSVAVTNKVPSDEMPKAIVVISDMEIDSAIFWNSNWGFYENLEKTYAEYGYQVPNLVFWNVNSRHDTYLVDGNRKGVQLVSGQSASTFKHVLNSFDKTPYQMMLDVLNGQRYSEVVL